MVAVHANRFLLFKVFEDLNSNLNPLDFNNALISSIPAIINKKFDKLCNLVEAKFSEAYPGNIFKNGERQLELSEEMSED